MSTFPASVRIVRADRLIAATLYLQRRGTVTAAELATHLEVSVATARRDLDSLGSAGIPVYPQRGRGGGWQLVGGARTDLTGLTEPEVRALFLAVGDADGDATARGALRKLVRALPKPFRESAEIASSAMRLDRRAWQQRDRPASPHESILREAILARRRCRLRYRTRTSASVRGVLAEPWRLVEAAGLVYLLTGTARGPRTYRLDRIVAITVTDERFDRPDEQSLDDQWQRTRAIVDAARSGTRAVIRADAEALAVLAHQFGTGFEQLDENRAVVAAHTTRGLAEQLAGWGSRVMVLDAPEVAAELGAIGTELVRTYRRGPGADLPESDAGDCQDRCLP